MVTSLLWNLFVDWHEIGQWDQGKIIKFGWTRDERLTVLNEEGIYRLYDLQGDYQQHSLGPEASELGIIDARIHDNGFVAMTSSLALLEVKGWEGGRPLTLANPGNGHNLSFTAIPHRFFSTYSTSACMVHHTARLECIPSCWSPLIGGIHHIYRGQFGKRGPAPISRTLYPCFTISQWQTPCALNLFGNVMGCIQRFPEEYSGIWGQ